MLLASPFQIHELDFRFKKEHRQSLKWIKVISNWHDEIDLLYFKIMEIKFASTEQDLAIYKAEKHLLQQITTNELADLKQEIEQHEHVFNDIIACKKTSENNYKGKHIELFIKIKLFKQKAHWIKNEVVSIIKSTKAIAQQKIISQLEL